MELRLFLSNLSQKVNDGSGAGMNLIFLPPFSFVCSRRSGDFLFIYLSKNNREERRYSTGAET